MHRYIIYEITIINIKQHHSVNLWLSTDDNFLSYLATLAALSALPRCASKSGNHFTYRRSILVCFPPENIHRVISAGPNRPTVFGFGTKKNY